MNLQKFVIYVKEELIKYLQNEKYKGLIIRKKNSSEENKAPISRKIDDNILEIKNHTYSLRNDILYTIEDLKQLESDYQEIIAQLTILNEISLNNKIRNMSNILYNNQHKLNQKPIYNPIVFKIILEIADKDLIGFFDELYIGT